MRLSLTSRQHSQLFKHLFPGDGLEAAAIALCGRACWGRRERLVVHKVHPIPYELCRRRPDLVRWSTEGIEALLEEASRRGLAILKLHSHPTGFAQFSDQDDRSDREFFASAQGWFDTPLPHASAVLLPDGEMFARTVNAINEFSVIDLVTVVGDDINLYFDRSDVRKVPAHAQATAQVFGEGSYGQMRKLRFAVVGASGTGSLVIEQLVRCHAAYVAALDYDRVEERNLNRILHTSKRDAASGTFKVDSLTAAVKDIGFELEFVPIVDSLHSPTAIRQISTCDIVFGCMDTIDGRAILNRLSTFYSMPYFDVGVRLDADGKGGIEQVCGMVHYLQPGRSSFFTRNVFSPSEVVAASLKRRNPHEYRRRLEEKYIRGARENRPAVMPVNMVFAGMLLMEFFARIHRYRADPNSDYAYTHLSLSHGIYEHGPEADDCPTLAQHVGRGDATPLLDMPDYTEFEAEAA